MIIGIEKIDRCNSKVHTFVTWLAGEYHNLVITSGYRSPIDNAALPNSSKVSQHCLGLAVDISVPEENIIQVVARVLNICPNKPMGLGLDIYKNYAHFDFREIGTAKWVYGKDGKEA